MPEIVGALAGVVLLLALGFAIGLRSQLMRTSREVTSDLERLSQALGDVRNDVAELRRELGEVRAATETVPIPPLPRARSGRLDDLREQLRASHRESEPASED